MIDVLEPGALTSVQTADGRPKWRHLGVPVGGAADPWSARLANRLVGNADGLALLEVTLRGPVLRFGSETAVAIAGAPFEAVLDGLPMPSGVGRRVRAGSLLRVDGGDGARCYVAVGGGLAVEPVLGSPATDLRTGFGGLGGRALRAGDRLALGDLSAGTIRRWLGRRRTGPVRIVPGPHATSPLTSGLVQEEWVVGAETDRTGVRLDGAPMSAVPSEVPSMGLPTGAIQVPPDGRPIVMLADGPVTGGYPVPACVIRADIGRVAALRSGDRVRFASVSLEAARGAHRAREAELADLADAGAPPPHEPGWAGALE